MKKSLQSLIIISMVFSIMAPFLSISAQVAQPTVCSTASSTDLKTMCNDFKTLCTDIKNDTQKNNCTALKKEVEDYAKDEKKLNDQKAISGSLSKEVATLTAEINKKKSDIAVKNRTLQQLSGQITEKNKTIQTLDQKRQQQETSLAEILRKKQQFDNYTLAEMMLSKQSLSEFLFEVDQLETINQGIQESFGIIRTTKQQTSAEKETLQERQKRENDVKYELENQKKSVETTQAEKNRTLQVSKGQEQGYQAVLADRQKRISEIRSALIQFQGSGVENRSISFGEAYDYAKKASGKTGIRPAFILAIMQQETNFGNNVGGCYVTKRPEPAVNGVFQVDGVYIKSGNPSRKTMIPSNYDNFLKITSALGMDWQKTPVSCAIVQSNGSIYGYGGAMGYTQFIPTTWMGVEARVRQFTNSAVASPWNPEHAVMATAVFLRDLGAHTQNASDEKSAACRYYGTCSTHSYGNQVMAKAAAIQQTINQLEQLNR